MDSSLLLDAATSKNKYEIYECIASQVLQNVALKRFESAARAFARAAAAASFRAWQRETRREQLCERASGSLPVCAGNSSP